jgi:hypothetical protein
MAEKPIALVTGVGPGTGAAIVRRFAFDGFRVIALARSADLISSHVHHGTLGRLVGDVGVPTSGQSQHRGGVDDPTAGRHVPNRRTSTDEHARHVDGYHGIPVFQGHFEGWMATVYAGVVEQNVDMTVSTRYLGEGLFDRLLVPHVGDDRLPGDSDFAGDLSRRGLLGVKNTTVRPLQRRRERQLDRCRCRLRPQSGFPAESSEGEEASCSLGC